MAKKPRPTAAATPDDDSETVALQRELGVIAEKPAEPPPPPKTPNRLPRRAFVVTAVWLGLVGAAAGLYTLLDRHSSPPPPPDADPETQAAIADIADRLTARAPESKNLSYIGQFLASLPVLDNELQINIYNGWDPSFDELMARGPYSINLARALNPKVVTEGVTALHRLLLDSGIHADISVTDTPNKADIILAASPNVLIKPANAPMKPYADGAFTTNLTTDVKQNSRRRVFLIQNSEPGAAVNSAASTAISDFSGSAAAVATNKEPPPLSSKKVQWYFTHHFLAAMGMDSLPTLFPINGQKAPGENYTQFSKFLSGLKPGTQNWLINQVNKTNELKISSFDEPYALEKAFNVIAAMASVSHLPPPSDGLITTDSKPVDLKVMADAYKELVDQIRPTQRRGSSVQRELSRRQLGKLLVGQNIQTTRS